MADLPPQPHAGMCVHTHTDAATKSATPFEKSYWKSGDMKTSTL